VKDYSERDDVVDLLDIQKGRNEKNLNAPFFFRDGQIDNPY
jgi:hypothetical protein